jgi:ornithine cyclodeaminase
VNVATFYEPQIRAAVSMQEAIDVVEKAFVAYSQKRATVPGVIHLDIPQERGEIHVKAAHMHGEPHYVIKIAAGFYNNRAIDLPVGSGMMLVFNARTGFPEAILIDNAWLTDLRTGAAGGVAARYMAPQEIRQVGVIGAGVQGRLQIEALACVRRFERVIVYDHHTTNIIRYQKEMQEKMPGIEFTAAQTPEEAVRGSQVVVTVTPSRQPIVLSEWVDPGTHITAVGSDGPDKRELQAELLQRAGRIIADSLPQCARFGEIHHALAAGLMREEEVDGELGDVIAGKVSGRISADEITICDLTGVGVQDAAIASLAYRRLIS